MKRKKKQTAVVEPKPDLKRELWAAADNLVSALYAYDMCRPMDDTAVADMPAPMRDLLRRRRLAVWKAQDELHVLVSQIRFWGFDSE